jgi:hypothetical protein
MSSSVLFLSHGGWLQREDGQTCEVGQSRSVKDPSLGHELISVRPPTVQDSHRTAESRSFLSAFLLFPLRCFWLVSRSSLCWLGVIGCAVVASQHTPEALTLIKQIQQPSPSAFTSSSSPSRESSDINILHTRWEQRKFSYDTPCEDGNNCNNRQSNDCKQPPDDWIRHKTSGHFPVWQVPPCQRLPNLRSQSAHWILKMMMERKWPTVFYSFHPSSVNKIMVRWICAYLVKPSIALFTVSYFSFS